MRHQHLMRLLQRHRKSEEKYRALENKSHNNFVKRSMPIMFQLGNTLNTWLCKFARSKLQETLMCRQKQHKRLNKRILSK